MTRVKSGVETKRRHKKILKEASGSFGSKHKLFKSEENLENYGLQELMQLAV